ncbi:hypothetical protein O181_070748 [Austropuccinia psidii MF-1]|uniref:Uncharacterized protein n=1 Tax=Austropuccinia psidii MF-1 TaxID=1389203 RepID=A0A9Q3EZQ5_9BASI|nr:hypothetical protein [Austropuccinia psidii MF-1]
MLADKHTRNAGLLSDPSNHAARGVPDQDALARTPLWSMMMKAFQSRNGSRDPKQADGNNSGRLAHDYLADEGWQWQEDIQAWANCHHVLSPMGFKRQSNFYFSSLTHFSSHNHTDLLPLRIEPNQLNPPQQDSPVPSLPCKQTLWQPTPGPGGTKGLEDLFRAKQPEFRLISTFDSSELTFPPFVEPSQTDEPPIPGPSPTSKPHEDVPTCEPEPEVALRQSMGEPFACPTPLHSIITIDNVPVRSLPPQCPQEPRCQAPLIPTMTLARNLPA